MDRQEYETYDTMEREDSASSVKKVTSYVWKLVPVAYVPKSIAIWLDHGHVASWALEKKLE